MISQKSAELDWLLDDLVQRVAPVSKAVILTRDGLAVAASQGLTREDAEHLAALAAGVQSMARGAGRHFGGGQVRQTIIEMDSAFLFVIAAGEGTCLAVLSAADADVGLVAYEMAVLVRRANDHLTAPRRAAATTGPAETDLHSAAAAGDFHASAARHPDAALNGTGAATDRTQAAAPDSVRTTDPAPATAPYRLGHAIR